VTSATEPLGGLHGWRYRDRGVATSWSDHVREIRRDPDSDAPRLVCADWLIDRGDLRGDYIVIACQHDALPHDSAEQQALREQLLRFKPHIAEWAKPLVALGVKRGPDAAFTRGFVNSVRLFGGAAFNLPAMCRLEPIVDLVLTSCAHTAYRALANAPELADLRYLAIDDENPRYCEFLFASPFLARLPELRVLPRWTPWIADAAANGTIRPARLKLPALDQRELAILVQAGFFDRMEDYSHTNATDEVIHALARAPLAQLKRLGFNTTNLTARAFEALGPRLDQLEHLSLEGTRFGWEIAAALIRHMRSGNLRSLRYASSDSDGLDMFVTSPAFRGVEELHLIWGTFNAVALERSLHRGKLRKLWIGRGVSHPQLDLPGVDIIESTEARSDGDGERLRASWTTR
jgi:uncharacterized protein (TIGR02996 family)